MSQFEGNETGNGITLQPCRHFSMAAVLIPQCRRSRGLAAPFPSPVDPHSFKEVQAAAGGNCTFCRIIGTALFLSISGMSAARFVKTPKMSPDRPFFAGTAGAFFLLGLYRAVK
mmetsp:Transcript_31901/g.63200  ORF Transcript_31901/g.63200 Transcript_31901/m.63200 type:complete len:114 (-) Transcript_31901:881-1222(-)